MTDFWDDFETEEEEDVTASAADDAEPADEELDELAEEVEDAEEETEEEYDSEEADSDVAAADEEEEAVEAKKMIKASPPARKGKKSGGKSKAEWIRDEIARRRDAGESLRPRDIIQGLAEHGVAVVAPQISVALRDMGLRATKEKETASSAAPANGKSFKANKAKKTAEPGPGGGAFSADELQRAHDFVAQCGGLKRTNELFATIAKLQLGR